MVHHLQSPYVQSCYLPWYLWPFPVVYTYYLSGLFGSITLTILFQGMFIVMPAFQMLLRQQQPAHPLLPLAARHVINPISFYRYVPSDCPSTSIAHDPQPLPVTPHPLFITPHALSIPPPSHHIYLEAPGAKLHHRGDRKMTAQLHMENAVLQWSCYMWHARTACACCHLPRAEHINCCVWHKTRCMCALKDKHDKLFRKYDTLKQMFLGVIQWVPIQGLVSHHVLGVLLHCSCNTKRFWWPCFGQWIKCQVQVGRRRGGRERNMCA